MTSRASAAVSATSATRRAWPRASGVIPQTWARTHSAPQRVLPKPRPASTSQVVQSPPGPEVAGANCLGRAQNRQSYSNAAASASVSSAIRVFRSEAGSEASDSASEAFPGIIRRIRLAVVARTVLGPAVLGQRAGERRLAAVAE